MDADADPIREEWRDTPCLKCSKDLASGKNPHAFCYEAWYYPGPQARGARLADCFDCHTKGFQCTALPHSFPQAAADAILDLRSLRNDRVYWEKFDGRTEEELLTVIQKALDGENLAKKAPIENGFQAYDWGNTAASPASSSGRSDSRGWGGHWGRAMDEGRQDQPARAGTWGMSSVDYTPSTSSASVRSAGGNGSNVSYKAPVAKTVDSDESAEEKLLPRDWGTYSPSWYAASNNSVHSTVPCSLRSAINFDSWGFPVAQIKDKVNHPAASCDPEQSLANTDVDMIEHNRLIKENIRLIDDYKRLVEDHQEKADENKRVVDDYKRLTEEVKQMAKNYERMASDFRCMASDFQLMAMNYSSMMEEKSAAEKEKKIRKDQIMALLE